MEKNNLKKYKTRVLLTTLGLSTALNLSACANTNFDTTKNKKNVITEQNTEEAEENYILYNKDDLKLIVYFDKEGNLKYRFGTVVNSTSEKFSDINETSLCVKLVTSDDEYVLINNFDKIIDEQIVQNITNGIVLDNCITLPDSNLKNYYGIVDINLVPIGANKNLTIYSEETLKAMEEYLNKGNYDINNNREEKTYKLENLQAFYVDDKVIIVDISQNIFTNLLFASKNEEVYYVPSITNPNIALKYGASSDKLFYHEGNVTEAYTLEGITSSKQEENEMYQTINLDNVIPCDINSYLTDTQKIVGSLSYEEIVLLEENLKENLTLKR